jgi:hypothetical protein
MDNLLSIIGGFIKSYRRYQITEITAKANNMGCAQRPDQRPDIQELLLTKNIKN